MHKYLGLYIACIGGDKFGVMRKNGGTSSRRFQKEYRGVAILVI